MRICIFIPPLPRSSGGLAVLYQLAARCRELSLPVALTSTAETAPGLAEYAESGGQTLVWNQLKLNSDDCYIVPEGWPNALAPGLAARCRCMVYAQNWAYVLSALPEGVSWKQLPVSFLAVSQPVEHFLTHTLGLPVAGTLRPAIDTELFSPAPKKTGCIQIAYMPRKNKALAEYIQQIATAMLEKDPVPAPSRKPLVWLPLNHLSKEQVAAELGRSHLFLSTGFPEGFGLPPLEAMACGCIPVGCTGFGGWDYMRQGAATGPRVGQGCEPPLPLRQVPWQGNGFFSADADVLGSAHMLVQAVRLISNADADPDGSAATQLAQLRANGRAAAEACGADAQRQALLGLWQTLHGAA